MAAVVDKETQERSTSTDTSLPAVATAPSVAPPEVLPLSLAHLPATLLGQHLIAYLSLAETRRLLTVSKQLYRQLPEIESHRTLWRLPPGIDGNDEASADLGQLYRAAWEPPRTRTPLNRRRRYYWNKIVELDVGSQGRNDYAPSVGVAHARLAAPLPGGFRRGLVSSSRSRPQSAHRFCGIGMPGRAAAFAIRGPDVL